MLSPVRSPVRRVPRRDKGGGGYKWGIPNDKSQRRSRFPHSGFTDVLEQPQKLACTRLNTVHKYIGALVDLDMVAWMLREAMGDGSLLRYVESSHFLSSLLRVRRSLLMGYRYMYVGTSET